MDDALGLLSRKQLGHTMAVFYAELVESEVRMAIKASQAGFFEGDVVVVVQVVNAHQLVAPRQQAEAGVHADEAGGAGEEDFHGYKRPSAAPNGNMLFTSNNTAPG